MLWDIATSGSRSQGDQPRYLEHLCIMPRFTQKVISFATMGYITIPRMTHFVDSATSDSIRRWAHPTLDFHPPPKGM
jgi:hypothetical protein